MTDRTTLIWNPAQRKKISSLSGLRKKLIIVQTGGGQLDDSAWLEDGVWWPSYCGPVVRSGCPRRASFRGPVLSCVPLYAPEDHGIASRQLRTTLDRHINDILVGQYCHLAMACTTRPLIFWFRTIVGTVGAESRICLVLLSNSGANMHFQSGFRRALRAQPNPPTFWEQHLFCNLHRTFHYRNREEIRTSPLRCVCYTWRAVAWNQLSHTTYEAFVFFNLIMRKSHRKSRHGCAECKRRRVKVRPQSLLIPWCHTKTPW